MAGDTPYTRTLERAAQTLGGEAQLADALHVPVGKVQSWLRGDETPPTQIFSAALDIVAAGRPPSGKER